MTLNDQIQLLQRYGVVPAYATDDDGNFSIRWGMRDGGENGDQFRQIPDAQVQQLLGGAAPADTSSAALHAYDQPVIGGQQMVRLGDTQAAVGPQGVWNAELGGYYAPLEGQRQFGIAQGQDDALTKLVMAGVLGAGALGVGSAISGAGAVGADIGGGIGFDPSVFSGGPMPASAEGIGAAGAGFDPSQFVANLNNPAFGLQTSGLLESGFPTMAGGAGPLATAGGAAAGSFLGDLPNIPTSLPGGGGSSSGGSAPLQTGQQAGTYQTSPLLDSGFPSGAPGGTGPLNLNNGELLGGAGAAAGSGAFYQASNPVTQWLSDATGLSPGALSALGAGGTGILSVLSGLQQSSAIRDIANQSRADRLPALTAYNNALANPDTFYNSAPAMGSLDAVLRKLSVGGNPAADPGALSKAAVYNLGGYNDYLRGLAGPAFGTAGTENNINLAGAQAQGSAWQGLGAGLESLFNPRQQYRLNLGSFLS